MGKPSFVNKQMTRTPPSQARLGTEPPSVSIKGEELHDLISKC
jgi:hypothetical protein